MLDRKYILDHVDEVLENCRRRGVPADVAALVAEEKERRALLVEVERLNAEANATAKSIGKASPEERTALVEKGRELRTAKDDAQRRHDALEAEILAIQLVIPNLAHPDAPIGADDQANLEIRHGKTPVPKFDFKPLDHLVIGEKHGWIDFEGGARTTGNGFYFLKGDLVLLDLALQMFAVRELMRRGFVPTITPDLAKDSILEGIGFIPRGESTQIYSLENMDLSLIGTAEITLGGLYAGKTFDEAELPLKLCGISHCYRTEAGAAGRASRGLYRVHQFTKVEMFAFALPDQSDALHDELCQIECDLFDQLGIPYRVVDTATGDLGGPAYRKFDLEAWMPGRGEAGEYGEVTSTSNCTDYQARRLNVRYRTPGDKGTRFVHTLNGTAIALSRALIAILENYQEVDGSVRMPEALKAYLPFEAMGKPAP